MSFDSDPDSDSDRERLPRRSLASTVSQAVSGSPPLPPGIGVGIGIGIEPACPSIPIPIPIPTANGCPPLGMKPAETRSRRNPVLNLPAPSRPLSHSQAPMNRRQFISTVTAASAAVATTPALSLAANPAPKLLDAKGGKIALGMDNFAVRAWGWKGRELVDYAAGQKLDVLFITDLPGLGSLETAAAGELRRYATDHGVAIHLGSWSICPTSKTFKKDWGTAEEHLAKGLRLSQAVGSPLFRVVLGSREDRRTPGGIEARIADTVKVLKSQKALAQELGVKVAIENHAGDLTATELRGLVEDAGKDFVGVNLDSGNALWTLEDPLASLEILGPYALSTSLRDTALWETEKGCKMQWTAFGEGGVIDWKTYFQRFAALCPGVPVSVETIGGFQIDFPYWETAFWDAFPKKPAAEFAQFLKLVRRGKAVQGFDANNKEQQRGELERSFTYLREVIGIGIRA
jgi:sugar phosphate isomerase/epimerase